MDRYEIRDQVPCEIRTPRKEINSLIFYLFIFEDLHWDKQGISIRILNRYEIKEWAPGGILTPRKVVYSLIF